ncbi:MAG: MetQ/NlpA family ABC transporter substrate-binding protein, partial [Brachybacterium sp.]|nr:MetQ/NlpA family ABC transporter substrate-binding protein [Brachybacterium sp.]
AALLPRTLSDYAIAVINGNYAMEADLKPSEDALALESGEDNPYANMLVVRTEDKDSPALVKLDELLHSEDVRAFIEETYSGAVIPAF